MTLEFHEEIYPTETLSFLVKDDGLIPTSPRQLHLSLVSKKSAMVCYRKWHYLGNKDFIGSYNFGVFFHNCLQGCISYGPPSSVQTVRGLFNTSNQTGYFEIKRLALVDELPKNSESRVIGVSIKLLQKLTSVKAIITYADSSVGHLGIIYKATGFTYLGLAPKKDDFYVSGKVKKERGRTKGVPGEWRPRPRKHKYVKIFQENEYEEERCEEELVGILNPTTQTSLQWG